MLCILQEIPSSLWGDQELAKLLRFRKKRFPFNFYTFSLTEQRNIRSSAKSCCQAEMTESI